jgi:hypothetical protein
MMGGLGYHAQTALGLKRPRRSRAGIHAGNGERTPEYGYASLFGRQDMMSNSRKAYGWLTILAALPLALLMSAPASGQDKAAPKAGEFIRVEVQGKLQTGIMAIGGETTGTIVTANGVTWELDLGQNADLQKKAEGLNGKQALVRGELTRRQGIEVKERWIVKVSSLEAAPEGKDK